MSPKQRTPQGTPVRAPAPISGDTRTGNLQVNSTAVSGLAMSVLSAGWRVGLRIIGDGLAANTTIAAIAADGLSLTLSQPAVATANGVRLTVLDPHEWTLLGPATVVDAPERGRVRVSGRFRALSVSDDGQRIYAGSVLGGLWYSEDGGARWKSLDFYTSTTDSGGNLHFADALTVGALAVRWGANAAVDVVYVGAGEHPLTELAVPASPASTAQGTGIRVATGPAATTDPWRVAWRLAADDLQGMVVYRLALDWTANDVVWAATSLGLYRRQTGAGGAWQKENTGLGDSEISDVVVVPGAAGEQQRVYVVTCDGRLARSIDGGPWQEIALPPYPTRRLDIPPIPADSVRIDRVVQRVRLYPGNIPGHAVVFALAEGPRLWRIDGDTAGRVTGLPQDISDSGPGGQSAMSLAVHPLTDAAHQDRIVLGGQAFTPPGGVPQAAIFRGQLVPNGSNWSLQAPEWVGARVPPGVQALAWVAGPQPNGRPQLWVAGDAGVYRSAADGDAGSFRSRCTGLPAVECTALAQSAGAGEVLLLATRGGALLRLDGETWAVSLPGRCGGVTVDPARPYRLYAQVSGATWKTLDLDQDSRQPGPNLRGWQPLNFLCDPPGGLAPDSVEARLWDDAIKLEKGLAAETSRMAAIANPDPWHGVQLALGTDRIWYRDDATAAGRTGRSQGWVTLPTGSDPFNGAAPDRQQDVLDRPVLLAHWAGPDRLYVLTYTSVYRMERRVDRQSGNTHADTTVDRLSSNVLAAGWQVGLPVSGAGIPAGARIAAIAADGRSLNLTAPPVTPMEGAPLAVPMRTDVKTGDTHSNTTVDGFAEDVRLAGWRVSVSIRGAGIPADATIAAIGANGRSLTLSAPATASANGVDLSVPVCGNTQTADTRLGDVVISNLSTDVQAAGWRAGAPVVGAGIPANTTIVSVAAGGRSVTLSNPAGGAANGAMICALVDGEWTSQQIYDQVAVRRDRKLKTPRGQIPDELRLACLDAHDQTIGTGSLYVGTSGDPEEHLWWYDGASAWLPTGLKDSLEDSPVHAVAADPADRSVVYAGTDNGVWQGRGVFTAGQPPTWTWVHFSNGLPEAPCVDLQINSPPDPTRRSLRAALAGRGVWEVMLDAAAARRPAAYLRATRFDDRRLNHPPGGPADPLSPQGRQLRLDASADICIARRPASVTANVQNGDTHANTTVDGLPVDVRTAGWRVGAPITGVSIPPGTLIADITNNGRRVTLSNPARDTANGVPLTVNALGDTQTGNIVSGSTDITNLSANVNVAGWQTGMTIIGEGIPPYTTITSIRADGLGLTISYPATATQAGVTLTAMPAAPESLDLPAGGPNDRYDIWLLQSALRLAGYDVPADGWWSAETSAALDARRTALGLPARPAPLAPGATAAQRAAWEQQNRNWENNLWQAVVAGNRLPFENEPPDFTDLAVAWRDEPDRWPKGAAASCASAERVRVQVAVNSRRRLAANTTQVVLLKTAYARRADLVGVAPLPAGWAAALTADLAAPTGAWLVAPVPQIQRWFYADPAAPARPIAAALEPGVPQVVEFDLNLSVHTRTGNITNNSPAVTGLASNVLADGWKTGLQITGNGLRANTTIAAIANDGRSLTLSRPASATAAARQLTVTGTTVFDDPGWLLLAVIVSDDDPLMTNDADVAALVRADPHVTARSVRAARRMFTGTAPLEKYAGMDVSRYPGQVVIDQVWSQSNMVWTGMYLGRLNRPPLENPTAAYAGAGPPYVSPAFTSGQFIVPPNPPGAAVLGAYRGHADASWTTRLAEISPNLGYTPIYFGHQDPHNVDWEAVNNGFRPKGPFDLRTVIAESNAEDAAQQSINANIPAGAVIYLDWEVDNLNWVLQDGAGVVVASGQDYCVAFFRRLAESGYRPGVYCRPAVGPILRDECPGLFVWNVQNARPMPNPPVTLDRVNGSVALNVVLTTPLVDRHLGTIARQWRLDYTLPPGSPVAINVIDLDLSVVQNPAFPERRQFHGQVAGGKAAAAARASDTAIYAIRSGRPKRVSWSAGAPAGAARQLNDDDQHGWNAFSVPAALHIPAAQGADPLEALLGLGYARAEGEDVWRLQSLMRRPDGTWQHQTVPGAGLAIDPLPGVVAASRGDGSIEAFVVNDSNARLAGARFTHTGGWTVLSELANAAGAATNPIRRTSRPAIVSPAQGRLDLFWTDPAGLVWTTSSAAVGVWSNPAQIGGAGIVAHPFSNLAAVSRAPNRMVVLWVGRAAGAAAGTPWRLCGLEWNAPNWDAAAQVIGGAAVDLEPLAPIAACSLSANRVDAFVVGLDGALYTTVFAAAAGAWSPLAPIAGAPPSPIASIDGAVCLGTDRLIVVVTGRDGEVYATQGTVTVPGTNYAPLALVRIP